MSLPSHFDLPAAAGKTLRIPSVGFGTWAAEGGKGWCKTAVLAALGAGYRHLDCAWYYGVDNEIGSAIRESGIPRSDIFITSKIWMNFMAPENVELGVDKILKGMGVEYLDLLLAHWPCAMMPTSRKGLEQAEFEGPGDDASEEETAVLCDKDGSEVLDWEHTTENLCRLGGGYICTLRLSLMLICVGKQGSFVPTLQAMQEMVRKGKARSIGISNFSISDIKDLLPHAQEIPISCNQVECHPWLPQRDLISFCREHKIVVSCYSPFAGQIKGGQTLIKDETVKKLASRNNLNVGQLLQSWAVQRGTIPLGKSQTECEFSACLIYVSSLTTALSARIKSNLNVQKLSEPDMKALDALEIPYGKGRTIDFTEQWGVKLYQDS